MSAVENKVDFVIGWVNATDNDEPGTGNWETKYTIAKGNPSRNFAIHTDPVTNEGILSVVKVSYSPSGRGTGGNVWGTFWLHVTMTNMTIRSSSLYRAYIEPVYSK